MTKKITDLSVVLMKATDQKQMESKGSSIHQDTDSPLYRPESNSLSLLNKSSLSPGSGRVSSRELNISPKDKAVLSQQ